MKHFTYDLIAAANDWIQQPEEAHLEAERRFESVHRQYQDSLREIKPRISAAAWNFFDSGHGHSGLHDGRLISLSIGDGLDYRADGTSPFRVNRQKSIVRIVFLNYEQDLIYTFDARGINSIRADLYRGDAPNWSLGDLYTYEICAADEGLLQLGFLFATGASVVVQFRRLVFRRQRVKRNYPIGDRYR
jgi:hypothetical protein